MMDSLFLDEDEEYQTECGKMLFTTKGRLIFHCTLCERKFSGFDYFEVHLKEHTPEFNYMQTDETKKQQCVEGMPIFNDEQMDEIRQPQSAVECLESEFKERMDANDSQLLTSSVVKEECNAMEEALKEEEMSLLEIRQLKRLSYKSGKRITKTTKQNKTNTESQTSKQLTKDQSAASNSTHKNQKDFSVNFFFLLIQTIAHLVRD